MAVKILIMGFRVVIQRSPVRSYQRFRRTYHHFHHFHFCSDDDGDTFLHNADNNLQDNADSRLRRPQSKIECCIPDRISDAYQCMFN